MVYDPKTNRSYFGAVDKKYCDKMAKDRKWEQPELPEPKFIPLAGGNVRCVFVGECEFPPGPIDLSQGDVFKND
ncbi:hypothetical protein D0962_21295 [Leptolyngbyaceae cyanobacterium CCMR0082]|uniref:Uncharacterized protein n=1 Tax=Adonisia turfae CCMR0082 TaxID=2304604 RepID=A0A6M0S9W9_9CYAN|nr:hypothetical protein [Adonisia turfae]NEZ65275.1 hypothetical protein [Adonisia turfae CCMR0082]